MFVIVPEVHTLSEGHVFAKPSLDLSQKAIEMGRNLSRLKSWIEAAEKLRCNKIIPVQCDFHPKHFLNKSIYERIRLLS